MRLASEDKIRDYRERGWWGDRTYYDVFTEAAAVRPEATAVVDPPDRSAWLGGASRRVTWEALRDQTEAMAVALASRGLGRGDRIIMQMPNVAEVLPVYFACAKLGAVLSPLPVQYGAFELRHVKAAVAPKAMIVAPRFKDRSLAATAAEVLGEDVELMTLGGEPGGPSVALEDLASGATGEAPRAGEADDAFTIAWTSGTTGMPKGVPRSHNHWLAIAPATYEAMQLQDGDVLLNPFPMTNMAAIGGMMSSWLHVRGQLVLHQPFDLPTFMKQLVLERVTATVAPPALLTMLLKTPKALEGVDLSHLRVIGSGSAPLSEFMVGGWRDRGIEIVNLFGSNEGVSLATGPREAESPARRAAWFPRFGHPAADFEVTMNERVETKLVAVDSGEVVEGPGTEGELLVRGPAVFEGYWGMSDEERSQVFDAEGFFRTGDLFKIAEDERFLVFSGRVKDIIIRGGHNISAAEIDGLLEGHPDLAEAAAFGVPDDVMGERIGVAVVPRPGAEVTLESVIEYLAAKDIAKNKLPEQLRILETLPRNPMNKVLRWKLVSEGPGRE